MSDDLQSRGGRDRTRIDVSQEWECRYWSEKFGVTPDELKRAVQEVGDQAADVEHYFEIHRPQMPIGVPDMGNPD